MKIVVVAFGQYPVCSSYFKFIFRTVARYLHRVIQRKQQKRVEATLLPIVERKSKRENAMLFFEILVSAKDLKFFCQKRQTESLEILVSAKGLKFIIRK